MPLPKAGIPVHLLTNTRSNTDAHRFAFVNAAAHNSCVRCRLGAKYHARAAYRMTGERTNPFGVLRRLVGNRRKSPRRRPGRGTGLLVGVRVVGAAESELLFAHVRDISELGLSAAVDGSEQELATLREARSLSLIIRLPATTLVARGDLVHAGPLGGENSGHEYLIGAHFTDISSIDLERLRAYLASLA
jgi:hypothetical protein